MATGAHSKSTEGPAIRSPSADTHNRQLVSLHGDDTGATVLLVQACHKLWIFWPPESH